MFKTFYIKAHSFIGVCFFCLLLNSCVSENNNLIESSPDKTFIFSYQNELPHIGSAVNGMVRTKYRDVVLVQERLMAGDELNQVVQMVRDFPTKTYILAVLDTFDSKNLVVMHRSGRRLLVSDNGFAGLVAEQLLPDSVYYCTAPQIFSGRDPLELDYKTYFTQVTDYLLAGRSLDQFGQPVSEYR